MVHTGVRDRKGSVGITVYSDTRKKTEEAMWSRKLYHTMCGAMSWCQKSVCSGWTQAVLGLVSQEEDCESQAEGEGSAKWAGRREDLQSESVL